jgi:hypothetical protein
MNFTHLPPISQDRASIKAEPLYLPTELWEYVQTEEWHCLAMVENNLRQDVAYDSYRQYHSTSKTLAAILSCQPKEGAGPEVQTRNVYRRKDMEEHTIAAIVVYDCHCHAVLKLGHDGVQAFPEARLDDLNEHSPELIRQIGERKKKQQWINNATGVARMIAEEELLGLPAGTAGVLKPSGSRSE